MGKRMNRRVSSKKCVKKGHKKRSRRPHVVSTPCHQPWSQHAHTPFTSLFSPRVLLSSCCGPHSFSTAPFWLSDKRRMVCVMSNNHTTVALFFLCQPSFSNHLFLLATSPHSCSYGVVMSVGAHTMQQMRPSEVSVTSAIITSLWCLGVCVVVSTITTALSHSLVASSIGCAMCGDCMTAW